MWPGGVWPGGVWPGEAWPGEVQQPDGAVGANLRFGELKVSPNLYQLPDSKRARESREGRDHKATPALEN